MQLHCLNIEHFASGKGLEKYMGGSLPSVIKNYDLMKILISIII